MNELHGLATGLQDTTTGLLVGKNAISSALLKATKALGIVDAADQEIPGLDVITDGLTVATGLGAMIASAFDEPKVPDLPKFTPQGVPQIADQFGA